MTLKKIISILICQIMLITLSATAFAESYRRLSDLEQKNYRYYGDTEWSSEALAKSTEPADTTVPEYSESNIKVSVNGKSIVFDGQKPVLINGNTYVPVRAYLEAMGAVVEWDAEHQVIIIENKGIQSTVDYARYYLRIGEPQLTYVIYNRKNVDYAREIHIFDMPQAPLLINGHTMLPFRCIGELLGALVYYDNSTHTACAVFGEKVQMPTFEAMQAAGLTHVWDRSGIYNNETGQFVSIAPIPILTEVTKDYFNESYNIYRDTKKVLGDAFYDDELNAAATWYSTDSYFSLGVSMDGKNKDGWYNSDGTYERYGFFKRHMANKYPNQNGAIPYERFGRSAGYSGKSFECPTGTQMLHKDKLQDSYYFENIDAAEYIRDCDYWYYRLHNMWGIRLFPLNDNDDRTINGIDLTGYKVNKKVYKDNYYTSYGIIHHWTNDVYRAVARKALIGWINYKDEETGRSSDGTLCLDVFPDMGLAYGIGIRYDAEDKETVNTLFVAGDICVMQNQDVARSMGLKYE